MFQNVNGSEKNKYQILIIRSIIEGGEDSRLLVSLVSEASENKQHFDLLMPLVHLCEISVCDCVVGDMTAPFSSVTVVNNKLGSVQGCVWGWWVGSVIVMGFLALFRELFFNSAH